MSEAMSLPELIRTGLNHPGIEGMLPRTGDVFAITPDLARVLASVIFRYRRRSALEFGAGSSSVVIARALALHGSGALTSVEQSPEWCQRHWERVKMTPGIDAQMLKGTPRLQVNRRGVYYAYDVAESDLRARAPYDLVFIDGPQWVYGRDGALHLSFPLLARGAIIVLDDAGRFSERRALARWLRAYPSLTLRYYDAQFGGKGMAVLEHASGEAPRLSLLNILTSAYDYARRSPVRRARVRQWQSHGIVG